MTQYIGNGSATRSIELFINEGLLQWAGPDNWIWDLPPEYPVWPVNTDGRQRPLSSLQIGDYIHCPMDPIGHSPIRIIGLDGEPYGFVCEACNALYTTTDLAPDEEDMDEAQHYPEDALHV